MSHHILNSVFRVGWTAMSKGFLGLVHVVGRISSIDIFETNVFPLLTNWNLEMIFGERLELIVTLLVVHFDAQVSHVRLSIVTIRCAVSVN